MCTYFKVQVFYRFAGVVTQRLEDGHGARRGDRVVPDLKHVQHSISFSEHYNVSFSLALYYIRK